MIVDILSTEEREARNLDASDTTSDVTKTVYKFNEVVEFDLSLQEGEYCWFAVSLASQGAVAHLTFESLN